MAVVTKQSTAITNGNATPRVQNPTGIENGPIKRSSGFAVIASGDSSTSKYRICKVRSSDFVDDIVIDSPDIGVTTAGDIGLYDVGTDAATGTVVDADFFASAVSLNGGALNRSVVRFESGAAGGLITNAEKRIWESLGLTTDPGKEYEVVLTLTADADAAGTAWIRVYTVRG